MPFVRALQCAILIFIIMCFAIVGLSHCSVKHNKGSTNSLGVLTYQENPNSYILVHVKNVRLIQKNEKLYTQVEYNPYGTYSEFKSDITFCGDQFAEFNGKSVNIALTYRTQQSQVWCYDLINVNELKPKKAPWE